MPELFGESTWNEKPFVIIGYTAINHNRLDISAHVHHSLQTFVQIPAVPMRIKMLPVCVLRPVGASRCCCLVVLQRPPLRVIRRWIVITWLELLWPLNRLLLRERRSGIIVGPLWLCDCWWLAGQRHGLTFINVAGSGNSGLPKDVRIKLL